MHLYELSQGYANLLGLIEEAEDPTLIHTLLQATEGQIQEKAANIVKFIKSMDADIDIIKAEEKRLTERRKAIENRRNSIKEYIQQQMELMGMDKIKTPTMTIALQNNPPSVNVLDEKLIPASYLTIIPETYVINKSAIREAIKNGEEVPGAELTQGKSLRVR